MLAENERAAGRAINMVPSETAMSGLAKLPLLLDTYHRYFFNETGARGRWHFRGAQMVGALESRLTVALLKELTGARHVTVRPLSGLSGMTLVLSALGGPVGSTIVTVAPEQGGHYATPGIARRLGLQVAHLRGDDPHSLDYAHATSLVGERRPSLVYVDQSNALFPIDVRALVEAVRRGCSETLVHVDASHWLGLVLGRAFENPLACGADSFGGSTHKTFPGPQKAVVATDREDVWQRIGEAQEYLISSHHFAATLSLGLALLDFSERAPGYAARIIENTRRFGRAVHERGLPVVAAERGFSAGHQLWIDVEAVGVSAQVASERLFDAGIRVNYLLDLPGFSRPGLRVGLNEVTYRGLAGDDIEELADCFVAASRGDVPAVSIAAAVANLRRRARGRTSAPTANDAATQMLAIQLCTAALLDKPVDEVEPLPWLEPDDAVAVAAP